MTTLASYSDINASVADNEDRTYTTAETDEFLRIVEAQADRKLRADFRRRTSTTVVIDSSGLGTLPTGFVGMTSFVRNVSGSMPLKQVSWDALVERNPFSYADDAQVYAINGTVIRTTPVVADNFIAKFSSTLTGLSSGAPTNWLLALAPDYYLFGCRAAAKLKAEDYSGAQVFGGLAADILSELVSQGNVAEFGNAEMTLNMVTP